MPDDTQLAFAHHRLPVGLSRHCHDNCDPVMTFPGHHDNPDNHENPSTEVALCCPRGESQTLYSFLVTV